MRVPPRRRDAWNKPPNRSGIVDGAWRRTPEAPEEGPGRRETRVCPRRGVRADPRQTCRGTHGLAPSRVRRSYAARKSSMCDPQPPRRPERRSGYVDGSIRAHNTLSPETTHVQVFYPFHPLHGATLQILRRPKRGDGAVSIIDPTGRRLKIPVWMLLPACAEIKITERPRFCK